MKRLTPPPCAKSSRKPAAIDDRTLDALDAAALEQVRRYYARMIDGIDQRIRRREREAETAGRTAAATDAAARAADMAMRLIHGGLSFGQATAAAARQWRVDSARCEAVTARAMRERDAMAREVRRAAVVRMAICGMTNGQIAEKLGIHRNTVSADLKSRRKLV